MGPTDVRSGDPRLSFPSADELPQVRELPSPFLFLDGTPVKTQEVWVRRRAEMKAMVLHYQFGHAPALSGALRARRNHRRSAFRNRSVRREVHKACGAFSVSSAMMPNPMGTLTDDWGQCARWTQELAAQKPTKQANVATISGVQFMALSRPQTAGPVAAASLLSNGAYAASRRRFRTSDARESSGR